MSLCPFDSRGHNSHDTSHLTLAKYPGEVRPCWTILQLTIYNQGQGSEPTLVVVCDVCRDAACTECKGQRGDGCLFISSNDNYSKHTVDDISGAN